MEVLKVTSFHVDFSTLDIERGKTTIIPSGINYTIQPMTIFPLMKLEGILIEENKDVGEGFSRTEFGTEKGVVTRESKNSETWLINNTKAMESVRRGLEDAARGRVRKVDLNNL